MAQVLDIAAMAAVLSPARALRDRVLHFGCSSCGATLSVPQKLAGVSGACPLCGEWLESPRPPPEPREKSSPGEFVASRVIVPDPALATPTAGARVEGQRDRRAARFRRTRFKNWFQRRQALLSVSALLVVAAAVVFFASMGWKLPWQLPEDSPLVRLIDDLTSGGGGPGGSVPTGPRRR